MASLLLLVFSDAVQLPMLPFSMSLVQLHQSVLSIYQKPVITLVRFILFSRMIRGLNHIHVTYSNCIFFRARCIKEIERNNCFLEKIMAQIRHLTVAFRTKRLFCLLTYLFAVCLMPIIPTCTRVLPSLNTYITVLMYMLLF